MAHLYTIAYYSACTHSDINTRNIEYTHNEFRSSGVTLHKSKMRKYV